MKIARELSRDTGRGVVISKVPDVCRSPVCPVPYTIVAKQSDDANTAPTVRMTGDRAHKQTSIITQCSGDEPGTGLGIKSGTVKSVCHRKTHSSHVRVEGQWATRHLDEWWMNNRNTFGLLYFVEDQVLYDPTPVIDWKLKGHPTLEPLAEGDLDSPTMASVASLAPQMTGAEFASDGTRQMFGGADPEDAWMRGQQFAQVRPAPRIAPRTSPRTSPRYNPRSRPFQRRHRYSPSHRVPGESGWRPGQPTDFFNHPSVRYIPPSSYLETYPTWVVPPGVGPIAPGNIELLPEPDGEAVFGREPVYRASDGKRYNEQQIQEAWNSVCRPDPPPLVLPGHNEFLDRVSRRRRGRNCRLRPYKEGCADAGDHSTPHHVTPDRVFRHPGGSTLYSGGVSHGDGLSICVEGGTPVKSGPNVNEHGMIHALVEPGFDTLGYVRGISEVGSTLFVCGYYGQFYRRTANGWSSVGELLRQQGAEAINRAVNPPDDGLSQIDMLRKTANLNAVDGISEAHIYTCGLSGHLYHYNGDQLNKLRSNTDAHLMDLHSTSEAETLVCGYHQTLLTGNARDGFRLLHESPADLIFWSVRKFQNQIYVGSAQGLRRYNGSSFDVVRDRNAGFGENTVVQQIDSVSDDYLWIVSDRHVFRYDGRNVEKFKHPDNG